MQVTDLSFLPFAALGLTVYYLVPKSWQQAVLLTMNLLFFLGNGAQTLVYLSVTLISSWLSARAMGRNQTRFDHRTAKLRNRPLVAACLLLNFGMLALCKVRFTFENLLLPMGISFYCFQSAGYVLDVYRGTVQPERKLFRLALFLSWFPQVIQGPISRYRDLSRQLAAPHALDGKQISFGLQRMLWGYFKKLVIADRVAPAVLLLRGPEYTGPGFLLLTLLYALQIYGDFTGGVDIALGLSEAFGIALPENFSRPFLSRSVAEYWRRWHITLGQWMKDYVFFPVSVSAPMRALSTSARRKFGAFGKRLPVYAATIVTWLCTGIWHGLTPNFLLWGMMNCAVILLSGELEPLYSRFHSRFSLKGNRWYSAFEVLRTFLLMNLIRISDLFPEVSEYFFRLGTLFCASSADLSRLGLEKLDWWILGAGTVVMAVVSFLQERFGSIRALLWDRTGWRYCLTFLLFLAVLLAGCYGIGFNSADFIYNQF